MDLASKYDWESPRGQTGFFDYVERVARKRVSEKGILRYPALSLSHASHLRNKLI